MIQDIQTRKSGNRALQFTFCFTRATRVVLAVLCFLLVEFRPHVEAKFTGVSFHLCTEQDCVPSGYVLLIHITD